MTSVQFEPLDASDLAQWLQRSRANYIEERVASGDSRAEAVANADRSRARTFPDGSPGPGQHVGRVSSDGGGIGELWVGPAEDGTGQWWVWSIEIDEAERGRGFGRATMLLAETMARQAGATRLGLNVFGGNAVARRLYRSLGYEEVSVRMRKELVPRAAGADAPPPAALTDGSTGSSAGASGPEGAGRDERLPSLRAEIEQLRKRVVQLEAEKAELLRTASTRDFERPPHYS